VVLDGTVQRLIAQTQALGRERRAMISSGLAGFENALTSQRFSFLDRTSAGNRSGRFLRACKSQGVLISAGTRYGNGNSKCAQFFRLAVGNERSSERIGEGLELVKRVSSSF
jgi:DNA-binding transcriptional MocR family regulator